MRGVSKDLSIGDQLSKEAIEKTFDTGFGYQIAGINPRRDENDERYVLVFAKEDGPYADSVKQGRFEFVGEGLRGDQKETSPGNSVLIDAISSDLPIYFFYKGHEDRRWEYQGLINVLGYEFEEHDGRQVIVFTMKHRSTSTVEDESQGLYLVPVNNQWRDKFEESVVSPVDLTRYDDVPPQLVGIDRIRIWGTTETDGAGKKQAAIDRMRAGDYCLFYHAGEFIAGGRVDRAFESSEVGQLLWDRTESRHIYTIENFTMDVPSIDRVWDTLGYNGRQVVQGFTRVAEERISRLDQGSVGSLVFGSDAREPTQEGIKEERSRLAEAAETEPQLTDDRDRYTISRRRARDSAFADLVKEVYDGTCAVCGSNRESPNGSPEVEAAHIYPRGKGGSDDARNGIALCRLHHWAFDSGWIAFTDDYEIVVRDAPRRNGYQEFKQLDGDRLVLPEDESRWPHSIFLGHRRELDEFSD
jgi:putative restriction endonuclease